MTGSRRYTMLADDGIRRFLAQSERFYPPGAVDHSMAAQRRFYERMCAHFRQERPPGLQVTDTTAAHRAGGKVPVRIYQPAPDHNLPVVLYLHGGGYVLGGLESHDDICAELALKANVAVLAVDYRLAPEHTFPAAVEDCRAVVDWLLDGRCPQAPQVTDYLVAGDSAGGNLAAGLALWARDTGRKNPRGQVLIYPALGGDPAKGSYLEQANAPGLSTKDMAFYASAYIGPPDHPGHQDKYACPLRETDFTGLAPAFMVACEFDPLRDDCFDYEQCLRRDGVEAIVRHEPLLVHAFLRARHMSTPAAKSFEAIISAASALAHSGTLPATAPA